MDRGREGKRGGREHERSRQERGCTGWMGEKTDSYWCLCLRSLIFC